MQKLIFFFLITFFSQITKAQSTKSDYENKTIFNFNGKYQKGINTFTQKELYSEIAKYSPEGGVLATKAKSYFKKGKIWSYVTLGLGAGAIIYLREKGPSNKAINLLIAAPYLTTAFFSIKFLSLGNKNLNKAVWLHNRDVLYKWN